MATPLLTTKLYRPPLRRELVSRERLVRRLNAGCHHRLLLISAPAGYGKTTLVSEWIPHAKRRVSWLSLDRGDNDPTRFLTYVIAAIQGVEPHIGVSALSALQSPQPPPVNAVLTVLINEMASIPGGIVLVLDDYHLIDSRPIHDAVGFLLDHVAPPRCPDGHCHDVQLAIVTRKDPPLPLPRLRASDDVTEIRASDLRFTEEEAGIFLSEKMGLHLLPQDVLLLADRTEGWVAGLHLAALSLQGREDTSTFIRTFAGDDRYIMDYLVGEVMSRQTPDVQRFLLRTAVLERLSGPLCDAVMGEGTPPAGSQSILEHLERTNLFTVPLDNRREWYRYHHLFAGLLRHRQRRSLGLNQVRSLHGRASEWYERQGHVSEALHHALAAGDLQRAALLVERSGLQMLQRSELATLMTRVDALPPDLVHARPWLCVFYAWALRLTGGRAPAVESWLSHAERALTLRPTMPSAADARAVPSLPETERHQVMGHISALRAFQALYREDVPQTLELAAQALEHGLKGSFERSSIAFAQGWGFRFSGDLEASCRAFGEARDLAVASSNAYMSVAAASRMAYNQVLAGQLDCAFTTCQEALKTATREDGGRWPVAGYALVYLGDLLRERNELEAAERCLIEGIELCGQVGSLLDQIVGWATLVRVRWAQRAPVGTADALQHAEALRQKMGTYGYARRWVDESRVRIWLAQGHLEAVHRWVRERTLRADDELTFNRDLEHMILARAYVGLGLAEPLGSSLGNAVLLLTRLEEMADTAGWTGKLIEILALRALALQGQGRIDLAMSALGRALALAEPQGYIRIFVDEGTGMTGLLREAAQRGRSLSYVQGLLSAAQVRGQTETTSTLSQTHRPLPAHLEPLSGREAEVLQLIAEGLSNREIADRLFLALGTVKVHTRNVYGKLQVHSRTQAVARARDLGLI